MNDWLQWLLVDMFVDAAAPDSPRFPVALACVAGVALTSVNLYLLLMYPQPLREPPWGFTAIMCGIVFGAAGAMLAGMHAIRERGDAPFAAAALLANVAAITTALLASTAH